MSDPILVETGLQKLDGALKKLLDEKGPSYVLMVCEYVSGLKKIINQTEPAKIEAEKERMSIKMTMLGAMLRVDDDPQKIADAAMELVDLGMSDLKAKELQS